MHTTVITTLAILAAPAVLGDRPVGIGKRNHASFVRVRRGGATIHLVGDETVASWSGGSAPSPAKIASTAATTATSYTNILDSINNGLGVPPSLLTAETRSALPASLTVPTTSAPSLGFDAAAAASSVSSAILSGPLSVAEVPNVAARGLNATMEECDDDLKAAIGGKATGNSTFIEKAEAATESFLGKAEAAMERMIGHASASASATSLLAPTSAPAVASASATYSNLLESIDAMLGVPMSRLTGEGSAPVVESTPSAVASNGDENATGPFGDMPIKGKFRRPLNFNASIEMFDEDHQAAIGKRATSNSTSTILVAHKAGQTEEPKSVITSGSTPVNKVLSPVSKSSSVSARSSTSSSFSSSSSTSSSSSSVKATVTSSGLSSAAPTATSVSPTDQATAQGWGSIFANKYTTMSVQNHAVTGASSRSFYRDLWASTLATVKSGDYVILEFGHYDNIYPGSVADQVAGCVGTVSGYGSSTQTVATSCNGGPEIVQTYNTYLNLMCSAVQAKGANCIISSLTPKNEWKRDNTVTYVSPYPTFAKEAAGAAGASYLPHEESSVKSLIALGETAAPQYFMAGNTLQTNAAGADNLARSFVAAAYCAGIGGLTSSFTPAAQALQGQYC